MNTLYTVLKASLICLLFAYPLSSLAQYTGTGSVTQGVATTVTPNLYECTGGRKGGIGTITATDKTVWTVPAVVNYTDFKFPFASDLYNECKGLLYPSAGSALSKLDGSDLITIDADGHVHREALLAPDKRDAILMPKECFQMEDDRMFVYATRKKEYRYGMITFQ